MMKLIARLACAAALFAALLPVTSCSNDDNNPVNPGSQQSRVMTVHTVPDGPAVDVLVDGVVVVPSLDYLGSTTYLTVNAGTRNVRLNLAGTTNTLAESNVLVQSNRSSTVFAVGLATSAEVVMLNDDLSAPAPGQAKVRFVHLAPDGPPVDLAVAGGAVVFSNTAFKGDKPFQSIAAGTYDLELRAAGTVTVLLPMPSITFEAGKIYTVYARGLVAGTGPTALGASLLTHN
jgi:hypothetical protein